MQDSLFQTITIDNLFVLKLKIWQEQIIRSALVYNYIGYEDLKEAIKVLKRCRDEHDLFEHYEKVNTKLSHALVLASQV